MEYGPKFGPGAASPPVTPMTAAFAWMLNMTSAAKMPTGAIARMDCDFIMVMEIVAVLYGMIGVEESIVWRKRTRRARSAGRDNVSTPPVPALRWATLFKTLSNEGAEPS